MSFILRQSLKANRLNVARTLIRFNSSFSAANQPRLRIGTTAPDFEFEASGLKGKTTLYDYLGDSYGLLFSHPADNTPVCSTELGAFSALKDEFAKRNTKLLGLSADPVESHEEWVKDIEEISLNGQKFGFPIVADPDRSISFLYDMVDEESFKKLGKEPVFTVRSVFFIDPSKKIRLIMTYPASTGRNTAEVLRCLDGLQLTDKTGLVTPIDWTKGQDVIVPPSVSTADAKKKYNDVREVKSYLRWAKDPSA